MQKYLYRMIKVELANDDKITLEKALLIANAVVNVQSIYFDGEYSYYMKVFSEECTHKLLKQLFLLFMFEWSII